MNPKQRALFNYELTSTIIRSDTVLSATLIGFLTLRFDLWFLPFFPLLIYLLQLPSEKFDAWRDDRTYSPIPKDFKSQISEFAQIPRNTFFVRGKPGVPRSISLLFIHIVIVPSGYETLLATDKARATILHEFGHGEHSDYFFVTGFWFSLGILAFMMAITFITENNELIESLFSSERGKPFQLMIPILVVSILSQFGIAGTLHRRELHADFYAYKSNPELYRRYIDELQSRPPTRPQRFDFYTRLRNRVLHPPRDENARYVLGKSKLSTNRILLPAVSVGACMTYIVFLVVTAIWSAIMQQTWSSFFAFPIGFFCVYQTHKFFSGIFSSQSTLSRDEKLTAWFGLLGGFLVSGTVFISANRLDYSDTFSWSFNAEGFAVSLSQFTFAAIVGFLQLAIYLKLNSRFGLSFFSVILAPSLFSLINYSFFSSLVTYPPRVAVDFLLYPLMFAAGFFLMPLLTVTLDFVLNFCAVRISKLLIPFLEKKST